MATLYARIPDDIMEWLRDQARESGLSVAVTVGAFLSDSRDRGMHVVTGVQLPKVAGGEA